MAGRLKKKASMMDPPLPMPGMAKKHEAMHGPGSAKLSGPLDRVDVKSKLAALKGAKGEAAVKKPFEPKRGPR
jgi:hypothetical protein